MLRDQHDRPVDPDGAWFVRHGTDVESRWGHDVPHLTPTERFFVRNHTEPPTVDPDVWRLAVGGDGVRSERAYSLADLRALPTTTYERASSAPATAAGCSATSRARTVPAPNAPAPSASPAGPASRWRRCCTTPGCATRRSR